MTGDDANQKDCEPMASDPNVVEALRRSSVSEFNTDPREAKLPWSPAPTGRRISFTAWGAAAVIGLLLWAVILKLV